MRILIAGIGNVLKSDDGFGPRVIKELLKKNLPKEVDAVDYGTSSIKALLDLKDYDAVIFVDAIDKGGKAGEIFIIRPSLEKIEKTMKISLHEVDLEKMLAMAKTLHTLPKKVIIVGCQPKSISNGVKISKEVEEAVKKTIEIILKILEKELLGNIYKR